MTTKLTFDIATLKPIIEHSRNQKEFSAPYGIGKPIPSLYFVKDHGIYLMSAAKKPLLIDESKPGNVVCYAKGYEPDAPDSYDKCHDVSGDDFADALPLSWFTGALDNGATKITLHVGAKSIRCTSNRKLTATA